MLDSYSAGGLDYRRCHYGSSRLAFRGPKRRPKADYIAFLGGSATFGKYVERPFPDLLSELLGIETVNLGCMHAGVTAFADNPSLIEIGSRARACVLQITGAHAIENGYFALHPRRNDRFIDARRRLRTLFPEVDFTQFHFTRHMLSGLLAASPDRFELVLRALRREWVDRTRDLIRRIRGPVVLLWLADQRPAARSATVPDLRDEGPLFVDDEMIRAVRHEAADLVEVIPSRHARHEGLANMVFGELERAAAMRMPGPLTHAEVATALYGPLRCLGIGSGAGRTVSQIFSISSGTAVNRSATSP